MEKRGRKEGWRKGRKREGRKSGRREGKKGGRREGRKGEGRNNLRSLMIALALFYSFITCSIKYLLGPRNT